MPTLPPEPAPIPDPDAAPHRQRHIAESFGEDADRYDRARPRYPEALVTRALAAIGPAAAAGGPRILDVGCGTGIVARQFREAGCAVLGVEIDERMAEAARRTGIAVEVAAFEQWDPARRSFDAVVCGQAWHWIDPVAGALNAARALVPGGLFAAFWNVAQPPPELAAAFADVYREIVPDLPNAWNRPALEMYTAGFAAVADGLRRAEAFDEPGQWRFDWQHTYTRDQWLEQVTTHGFHTRMPPTTLSAVLEGLGTAVDAVGGAFAMDYATVAVTATAVP
jgi:SAM-dependent methyltransferase